DDNARDQFGGEPETDRHGGRPGCTVFACSRLVSPDFPAVANFGQPPIQTSEPCGKRSFVGRFIAISVSVAVRAIRHVVRHVVETRSDAPDRGNCAPSPLKAARTILTATSQVKIAC